MIRSQLPRRPLNKTDSSTGLRRITLKCGFALGDIVALTGAVRELHEQYPGAFLTDVETSSRELWWYNP